MSHPTLTRPLRLLPGTELLGRAAGSGLREPPHYVRRPDGQVVQLSRLLFEIAAEARPDVSDAEIAERAGGRLAVRIAPDQVRYVLERKLHPLGIVCGADGAAPPLMRRDPLLGLSVRFRVLHPPTVDAIARVLAPLFRPAIVVAVAAALIAFDVWLLAVHGLGAGLTHVIDRPAVGLLLLAISYGSIFVHECGHAAACRYGGGRPGAMGGGLLLVWPALYTDLTDSYRFGRAGRLRTDLGGIYFNGLCSLALAAAYGLSGYEPLLLAIVAQHALAFNQFLPWARLDGYYVVADAIGVPDLFARVRPVMRSLVPGRAADPRVAELRTRARVAVTAWVLTALVVLVAVLVVAVTHAPAYLQRAWASLVGEAHAVGAAAAGGHVLDLVAGCVGALLLVLPIVAMTITYVLLCRRAGRGLALAGVETDAPVPAVPAGAGAAADADADAVAA